MSPTVAIIFNFIFDFIITAGSIVGGAMVQNGGVHLPSVAVWVLALVMGVVLAGRRAQAAMNPGPGEQARGIDAVVAEALAAIRATQPVTPVRVALPEDPVTLAKDSS